VGIKKFNIISVCFVAAVVVIPNIHVGHAGEREAPPIPHNVICEMSGYDLGTPQNRGCTTLLDTFPPRHYPITFQYAVVRSINMGRGGSSCSMIGGVNEMVRCTGSSTLPAKLLPK
jgi:hypothetical protein